MYPTTRKIRDKGYSLEEFYKKIGRSSGWYREHCKVEGTERYDLIIAFIDKLDAKPMKHWVRDNCGFYRLALDKDYNVLSVHARHDGNVEVSEECDSRFSVEMSKSSLIDALRELADELESK